MSMEVIPACGAGWSTVQCPVSSCVFLMASSDVLGVGCRFDLIDNMFSSCVQYVPGPLLIITRCFYSVDCTDSVVLFHISNQPITLDVFLLNQSSRFGP